MLEAVSNGREPVDSTDEARDMIGAVQHRAVGSAVALALFLVAAEAHADDVHAAADAFARAQKLALEGKPDEAADLFELADELAPSAPALRNAARARLAAGHIAMAATEAAELLRRYPDDATSRSIAEKILSDVGPKVARIDVTCRGGCSVLLDGKATLRQKSERQVLFAKPGEREISARFADGGEASRRITVAAGSRSSLTVEPPARSQPTVTRRPAEAPPSTRPRDSAGISRWWVISGSILTLGLGAAATYEGLATLDDRDQIRELVAAGDIAGAEAAYDEGRDRQLLTNVLIGAAAAAGVATLTAAFFTDWSGGERAEHVTLVPAPDGVLLGYVRAF